LAFCKLEQKQDLIIKYPNEKSIQRNYEPDFLVKTEERIFLFETKGGHLMDSTTALKTQAAVAWCKAASTVKPPRQQPQEWKYLILKQSVFDANLGSSFSALLPLMWLERETLIASLHGALGLQI
jgi:type III restriction enzyme